MKKLDYTIKSYADRLKLVEEILEENPNPNEAYLELMGDYLINAIEKEEKANGLRTTLTENRLVTINKRETSFEGLASQLENGEDGIYNMITNDKNVIFQPKVVITKRDVETIPNLKELREAIKDWEAMLKKATGRDAYLIKKNIIEMRKEQYVLKNAYYPPMRATKVPSPKKYIPLDDDYTFDEEGFVIPSGVSLCDPRVCQAILCNYSRCKQDSEGQFDGDLWYLMIDFDNLAERALADYPLYDRIVEYKIDGMPNVEIQEKIEEEFGIKHSVEYISSLWRNKIPKILASQAEDDVLDFHYLVKEKGQYKKCSRCGEIKLAHNKYFSKNKTSKDGFYSICKKCRNQKDKKV